jgi:hypothetical protein
MEIGRKTMCHFVSWIEYKGKVYYLNDDRLNDRRGKELRDYETDPDEWRGHGSILWYYGLEGKNTVQKEVEDFSSPDAFPPEIVADIKAGKFKQFGVASQILTPPARAEYEKVRDRAWAEYEKVRDRALAEYEKVEGPEWAEYEKVEGPAWAEWEKVKSQTFWTLASKPENRIEAWR